MGEVEAGIWSLESRLFRCGESHIRVCQGIDNTSACGAFLKGRSSSRQINRRCQSCCAVSLTGFLEVFLPWVASANNPADAPSSWYGIRQRKFQPAPGGVLQPQSVPRSPRGWCLREHGILHLCSGPRRPGDLQECLGLHAATLGVPIFVLSVDPKIDKRYDLAVPSFCNELVSLLVAGNIVATVSGPPCNTFSAVRHVPLPGGHGPRPIRSRSNC